ncbi:MAG TPA: Gfo/Idh/MocA family oxidoreductase [Chloroflexota bacterium]|nr:Gfo/Idh/MocA family oxidoreductase [Chloroflexota bacterium]
MTRIGFVGVGSTASAHLAALQHIDGVRLAAFVDSNTERAQERAAQYGARAVPELPALWEHVDAVWVCSPPHLHLEHAVAAARAGCHVFVERPIAHSLEAAEQMVAACKEAGVRLMVGLTDRFTPVLQRLRQLLVDGDLGTLVALWSRRFGETSPAEIPWWRRDWRRGGGFTIEWGTAELDFIRWTGEAVAGPVRRVHGRTVFSRDDYPDFDDFARATLTFDSGAVGGFEGGLGAPLGGGTGRGIIGTRAMALVEGRALRLRHTGDGAERIVDVPPSYDPERHVNTAVLAQDREFIAAIVENREPSVTGADGWAALQLCLAIHRSSREGQEIVLEPLAPGAGRVKPPAPEPGPAPAAGPAARAAPDTAPRLGEPPAPPAGEAPAPPPPGPADRPGPPAHDRAGGPEPGDAIDEVEGDSMGGMP